jgi:hypothetical protein
MPAIATKAISTANSDNTTGSKLRTNMLPATSATQPTPINAVIHTSNRDLFFTELLAL